jgi:hypothetical protein
MTNKAAESENAGLEAARRRVREILAREQFVEHAPHPRHTNEFAVWDTTAQKFRFPAFQYNASGEVRPEMRELLALLPTDRSGWRVAFWLYQPHGRLGGARPVDAFATDPAAVIAAAVSTFHPGDTNW